MKLDKNWFYCFFYEKVTKHFNKYYSFLKNDMGKFLAGPLEKMQKNTVFEEV